MRKLYHECWDAQRLWVTNPLGHLWTLDVITHLGRPVALSWYPESRGLAPQTFSHTLEKALLFPRRGKARVPAQIRVPPTLWPELEPYHTKLPLHLTPEHRPMPLHLRWSKRLAHALPHEKHVQWLWSQVDMQALLPRLVRATEILFLGYSWLNLSGRESIEFSLTRHSQPFYARVCAQLDLTRELSVTLCLTPSVRGYAQWREGKRAHDELRVRCFPIEHLQHDTYQRLSSDLDGAMVVPELTWRQTLPTPHTLEMLCMAIEALHQLPHGFEHTHTWHAQWVGSHLLSARVLPPELSHFPKNIGYLGGLGLLGSLELICSWLEEPPTP